MKTIVLEDEVFAELNKLTTEFFSHNDVIRKLLLSRNPELSPPSPTVNPFQAPQNGSIVAFIQSAGYRMQTSGINRYLTILSWLHKTHAKDFQKVENYKRGNRIYFARSQKEVEQGGNGAIQAKQIPNSPVWTLATLDNRTKRMILTDLLPLFGFKNSEVSEVVSTISDSGRHRGINPFQDLMEDK